MNCEICEEDGIDRPGEERGWWKGDGPVLCDACCAREAEAAHERMLEDYYGGSGLQTLGEQYAAVARVKREQR